MSYPPQGGAKGISRLSELVIDAGKDWGSHAIDNIAALSLPVGQGDLYYHHSGKIRRLAADYGAGHNFLTVSNTLAPKWIDIQDFITFVSGAVNRMVDPPVLVTPVPQISLEVIGDASGGAHPVESLLEIPAPQISGVVESTSVYGVSGAVSHDEDGLDSDETAEANDPDLDNMTLLQADGAIEDWYAIGYTSEFDGIVVSISQAGAGITLNQFDYSKGGGSWGLLSPIMNQLDNYTSTGKRWFTFARPLDWATDTIAGLNGLYWIRLKSSATGAGYSQPLGAQAWILKY
jgi:hypothetical protein